jgi:hypothetical protein
MAHSLQTVIAPYCLSLLSSTEPSKVFKRRAIKCTKLFLFVKNDDNVVALVVNHCSALWDAMMLKAVLETFCTNSLGHNNDGTERATNYTQLGGWKTISHELQPPLEEQDEHSLPLEWATVKNHLWDTMIWTSYRLPPQGTIQEFLERPTQILVQISMSTKTLVMFVQNNQSGPQRFSSPFYRYLAVLIYTV